MEVLALKGNPYEETLMRITTCLALLLLALPANAGSIPRAPDDAEVWPPRCNGARYQQTVTDQRGSPGIVAVKFFLNFPKTAPDGSPGITCQEFLASNPDPRYPGGSRAHMFLSCKDKPQIAPPWLPDPAFAPCVHVDVPCYCNSPRTLHCRARIHTMEGRVRVDKAWWRNSVGVATECSATLSQVHAQARDEDPSGTLRSGDQGIEIDDCLDGSVPAELCFREGASAGDYARPAPADKLTPEECQVIRDDCHP